MSEGTKSDKWAPPSREKMAKIYDERDALRAEVERLRLCIEVVRNGWTKGQPSSMNLVIAEVETILAK